MSMLESFTNYRFQSQGQHFVEEWHKYQNEQKSVCPICLHLPKDRVMTTKCRHLFCNNCLKAWLTKSNVCPLCKQPITKYVRA